MPVQTKGLLFSKNKCVGEGGFVHPGCDVKASVVGLMSLWCPRCGAWGEMRVPTIEGLVFWMLPKMEVATRSF